MFTRLSAVCLAAVFVCAAVVQAQQQTQPGQEGPPSAEFPPPRVEQGPAPRPDGPPPRVEGVPDNRIPPRAETPPPRDDDIPRRPSDSGPPPRAERPDDRPPPRSDRPGTNTADRCGAVAYTADGAFGGAYGMEDCRDAERLAVDECQRESTDKADCSRGVLTRRSQRFYIQFCRDGRDWTTHVTTDNTLSGVNQAGLEWARKSKFGAANCRLVPNGLFHSGGLHTRM
jgi:hypothetical protein